MKLKLILTAIVFALLLTISASAQSTDTIVTLQPGGAILVTCTGIIGGAQVDSRTLRITCPAITGTTVPPTATSAVPTVTPGTPTPSPTPHDMADMAWHSPGAHGDRPAHEHGDRVPAWVTAAGYTPTFGHVAGTPNENHLYFKHTAFKGWAGRFSGVDWYGIFHLDFNPGGEQSRFHSYQLWLRDATGAVSHMHGWLDFGEDFNTGPNLVVVCGTDNQTRPIIMTNKVGCPVVFSNWYANAASPGPDLGWNINPNYFAGGDPTDPSTWVPTGGIRNLTRRFEFAWYGLWGGERRTGDFYTTQFGNVVSGPNDPLCGTTISIGDRNYTLVCIKQHIEPTLTNIEFPGNAVQRTFVGGSGANAVRLPN